MKKKNKESKIIFLILLILFTVFLILPVFRLLLKSFWGEEGPTLAHYSGVIFPADSERRWETVFLRHRSAR